MSTDQQIVRAVTTVHVDPWVPSAQGAHGVTQVVLAVLELRSYPHIERAKADLESWLPTLRYLWALDALPQGRLEIKMPDLQIAILFGQSAPDGPMRLPLLARIPLEDAPVEVIFRVPASHVVASHSLWPSVVVSSSVLDIRCEALAPDSQPEPTEPTGVIQS